MAVQPVETLTPAQQAVVRVGIGVTDRNRMAALAQLARVADNQNRTPLIAPPAWTASTAYAQGAWVANGGNWYHAYTGGTSAASGGPTETGPGDITDGTVVWHYMYPAPITANDTDAPTVTTQVSGTVTGLTKNYARSSPVFHYTAGRPTEQSSGFYIFPVLTYNAAGSGAQQGQSNNGSGPWSDFKNTETAAVIFATDAPKITLKGYGGDGGGPLMIYVDGRPLGAPVVQAGGTPSHVVLTFPTRKPRRITVEGGSSFRWVGASVDPLSTIWAPRVAPFRMAWMADSFGEGAPPIGPVANAYGMEWPALTAKYLGIEDFWPLSEGGTGFVAKGSSNNVYNYAERAAAGDFAQAVFDIIVIGSSVNDGGKDGPTITANATATIQRARADNPNAFIFVHGLTAEATNAFYVAADAATKAAVTALQASDMKLWWIPAMADTIDGSPWLVGTGKNTAPAGNGNQDIYRGNDGTHPTIFGIEYRARRTAAFIRSVMEASL